MANKISAPRGTKDVLPSEVFKWHFVEKTARETARLFGYTEIRFPTFEHTELFLRGVGDTTDIVQKEMYTFEDKGGRSITLRPEGTASVVRAMNESSLLKEGLPVKVYYISPNFRYEKPQAGRLREHHQFGVECFGSPGPAADVEIISLGKHYLSSLGVNSVELVINSIGCPECRAEYNKALVEYLEANSGGMCELCNDRIHKNPLRVLDCKNERCGEITKSAPVITEYLCEECTSHFDSVKHGLKQLSIPFTVNPRLVRGLDYYTRTVFEFVSQSIGAQGTVLAGGRYDGLVSELGGQPTPGLGFGSGIERILLQLEAEKVMPPDTLRTQLFIAVADGAAKDACAALVKELRSFGVSCEYDLMDRGLKAQMKYADRIGAGYSITLGGEELEKGICRVRDMSAHGETECPLKAENIAALINSR
jgi:histidyl-tRNA synthetase